MTPRVLVYGYGNPGRLDDGLGPALARDLVARGLATCDSGGSVTVESGYQLQVEDAALVAEQDVVIFADATVSGPGPFELRRLEPRPEAAFTTHAVAPEAVLALAREHFQCDTLGYVLGIRGYRFDDFGEELSPGAQRNLAAAADYMCQALRDGSFASPSAPARPER